jgi:ribonucleotide reductase alpha subunit
MGVSRGLPISCFGIYAGDSIESITDKLGEVINQTKLGGGTSGYFGELRGRGAPVKNNGESSGAVSFLNLFDTTMTVVSQGGIRRGNFAAYLDIDHPDIEEFIKIKDIGNSIQNLFYGVNIPDWWMNDMVYGKDIKKRELWTKILKSRQEKGLPYILFSDTINENKPQIYKELNEVIHASNLCFTGDTVVAIADGTNGKTIKELAEFSQGKIKFPVYCATDKLQKNKIGKTNGGIINNYNWKTEIKNAVAFKTGTKKVIEITLSNGDKFKCTPNHELA